MTALIELENVHKSYPGAGDAVEVLRGISISIQAGEFVAIVGQSGSGKSTLMNIIGLLDAPSSGRYRVCGRDVTTLDSDDLARFRRGCFGFVFQQYNLLPGISALRNVEMPGLYAGLDPVSRRTRAANLLAKLGLENRLEHRPDQLSGGQQQRVSIARALMNGGCAVLADEPTGALDSSTGAEVMALLTDLWALGHTVVLITHDSDVAKAAHRVIEIKDGIVSSDTSPNGTPLKTSAAETPQPTGDYTSLLGSVREALTGGGRALLASPFRTALTLLGIIVGVAATVLLLAIGQGARQAVVAQLNAFGSNVMYVSPGGETPRSPRGQLFSSDVDVVRGVPNVEAAMPFQKDLVTVRYANIDHLTNVDGVTTEYLKMHKLSVADGVFFNQADERALATVAVLGHRLAQRLFPGAASPLRRPILINNVPFTVIGVLAEKGSVAGDSKPDDIVAVPYDTLSHRIFGRRNLSWISISLEDPTKARETEVAIQSALERARRIHDFEMLNQVVTIEAQTKMQNVLAWLLAGTASISLLVGGVGVMNVMLMTVSERTREIGIRMAVGARKVDILRQFLIEAMMVSGAGGLLGALVGLLAGITAATVFRMPVIFSGLAIAASVFCAILTGLMFGLMPALRAARMQPVSALARE